LFDKSQENEGEIKMLVITRKEGESIMIGDEIEIIVIEYKDNRARIGIKAPRDVPVDRREIREKISRISKSNEE